jgi:protein-disulfide isomerase
MRDALRTLLLSMLVLWSLGSTANAAEFNDGQRREIETIVKDYLLANPEILQEAAQALERRQKQAEDEQRKDGLIKNADQIFRDKSDHVAGNPKGNVTMVEFFDYNCTWCKKSFPDVMALIDVDKNLKVVFKEFPILGADSEYAAKAAIAAGKQGKYLELHKAMYQHEGRVTKEAVDGIAAGIGLNMDQLEKDMDNPETAKIIVRNRELAQALAVNGTPAFIIDDKLFPGYLPKDELASAIKDVRAKGACSLC